MRRFVQFCVAGVVACGLAAADSRLMAEDPPAGEVRRQYEEMVAKATSFLLTKGRGSDGSYSSFSGPGVTSLVTTSLLRNGASPTDPRIEASLAYIRERIQPDGGIYQPGSLYRNYETCLAMLCFTEANRDGKYDQTLKRADAFVKGIQWDEEEGKSESDLGYGGAGYGSHKRPDLSNTTFLIEALKATGNGADSEAMQRALIFVSRCQNLESEHNTTAFAAKNPDGGFYYTPDAGGTSQAGTTDSGGLRSYASMTYAGLKSMIYAGVGPEDQRVKAAYTWIGKNYDLASNPGMGSSGLYYYYHTFAKALDAMGVDQVEDEAGVKHDWRAELIRELAKRQQPDGSWLNENDRWLEGDPNLVTGYALLALSYCKTN
ncbi:MAG TPA: terpene cyclase/mutase family protein [Pirellulaceae bacterium]|nr:terpene cyclase/mutase family protein [Planctomycetales bacterium]MCB9939112.1 terpene cyclase/mutase family protein [Planctomycetaceae bacterium]HRX79626.1 terpene cyclase/mutase family protein [Pirellulaceae bacterium]